MKTEAKDDNGVGIGVKTVPADWRTIPGAVPLIDGTREIDGKLADAMIVALKGGYTVEQVRAVCVTGLAMANTSLPARLSQRGEVG